MKTHIKIAGAGISGLTAAINLVNEGFDVQVFEKCDTVGCRFSSDFQGLENWTGKKDILDLLKEINIKINFKNTPFNEVTIYSPSLDKVKFKTKKPLFYLVKRGKENSLDYALMQQALDLGIKIEFNSPADNENCDIIATGPKRVDALAFGITFETELKNMAAVILNDRIAAKGYAYLSIVNNEATLATVLFSDIENAARYLNRAISEFKKIFDFKINNKKKFSGYANFLIPKSAQENRKLYVGEAAGFQDFLTGFGMRYAFLSGYFAARSIIDSEDYDKLWKESFLSEMKGTKHSRMILEKIGNNGYEMLIKNLKKSDADCAEKLRKLYKMSLFKFLYFLR